MVTAFDLHAAQDSIEARNRLRLASHLPLLDVGRELDRLAKLHRRLEFETFLESHRTVYNRALRIGVARYRRIFGHTPHSFQGMWIEGRIRQLFRRRFDSV